MEAMETEIQNSHAIREDSKDFLIKSFQDGENKKVIS